MSTISPSPSPARVRRGFSLTELMIVLLIIALIISILVPTIGGARNAARATGTRSLLTNLSTSMSKFQGDTRRLPGYFSWDTMGHADNIDRGMTGWENVMLDLMGEGAVRTDNPGGAEWLEVGPRSGETVWVNASMIGASEGGYFRPNRSNLAEQDTEVQRTNGAAPHAQDPNDPTPNTSLPDLVDDFGVPVLVWVANTVKDARNPASDATGIARQDSSANALFYWATNASLLRSDGGRYRQAENSLLGTTASAAPQSVINTMTALFGSPSFPGSQSNSANPLGGNAADVYPTRARGTYVLQSAGKDRIYLSREDDNGRANMTTEGGNRQLAYRTNFFLPDGARLQGDDGNDEQDVIEAFDDIVVAGGS